MENSPRLARDLRVEDDLEEEVAELFPDAPGVAGVEGVEDLVGLLDEERAEGLAGLLSIPGTPALAAQAGHHREQLDETLAGVRARHRGPHVGVSSTTDSRRARPV